MDRPTTDETAPSPSFADLAVGAAFTFTTALEAGEGDRDGDLSRVALAAWAGALLPELVASALPGTDLVYRAESLEFLEDVGPGESLSFTVSVRARGEGPTATLGCTAVDGRGRTVLDGTIEVVGGGADGAPGGGSRLSSHLVFHDHHRYEELVRRCREEEPLPTAVVQPTDEAALLAAVQSAEAGIIDPILVGPRDVIEATAAAHGIDIDGLPVVDAETPTAAADAAVDLVRDRTAQLVMKGNLHTDELLRSVTAARSGLRGQRRISHVFVFDVPTYPKPLFVTDAVVNITPDLDQKADIIRNAVDLAHALGVEVPRVAILSAVETVNPAIRSTVDAAALCKMADRGQITGALLDGPLAMDNAISAAAATSKHISSPVAGDADVLVVPDLEAGNILYKNLTYLAGADVAGVVVGARVPVILASRADTVRTRIASAALAALYRRHLRTPPP